MGKNVHLRGILKLDDTFCDSSKMSMWEVSVSMLWWRSDPVLLYGDENAVERPGPPPSSPIGDQKQGLYVPDGSPKGIRGYTTQCREHAAEVFLSFTEDVCMYWLCWIIFYAVL